MLNYFYLAIFILILIFSPEQASAQSDSLLKAAREHKAKQAYPSAFKCYYLNSIILEKENQSEKLAQNYIEMAQLCNLWGINLKAVSYYQKAQEIYEKINAKDLGIKADFLDEKIAKSYEADQKYAQAIPYYEKILKSKRSKKNIDAEAKVLANLANLHNLIGNYNDALNLNLFALAIYEQNQDKQAQAILFNNIGFGYQKLANSSKAITYFEKAKQSKEALNETTTTEYRTILVNLAILYQSQKELLKAKQYFILAEQSLEKDTKRTAVESADIYNLMTKTYLYSAELDKVLIYANKALKIGRESQYLEAQKTAHETLSNFYTLRNQNKTALEEYKNYNILSDSILKTRIAYQEALLQRQKISDEAENELKLLQAEQDLKALDLQNFKLKAEKEAKEFEVERQKQQIAISALEQVKLKEQARANSLLIEKQRQEGQLQTQALEIAQQGNRLKEAELENIKIQQQAQENERISKEQGFLREKELKEKELKTEKEAKKLQRNFFLLIVAASIVFLIIFAWAYLQKRKSNEQLKKQKVLIEMNNQTLEEQKKQILEKNNELNAANEELTSAVDTISAQNEQLEVKNKSILDSINYAQRIQIAILPNEETLVKIFPQSFVLFMPRDVVSGDFFQVESKNDKRILAVVDCTGHGVPGAFMTIIASEILHEIIQNKAILEADLILNELHKRIRIALKQEETNNRDGMDLVLLVLNTKEKIVEFAGAQNSLIYIQNNNLVQIKGDRIPIGGEQREQERIFTKHLISVEQPTTFYLFSDGYQDQFGGVENKKFSVARMKEIFLQIYQQEMPEQKNILHQEIIRWIKEGNEKQIDDILLIGLHINPE